MGEEVRMGNYGNDEDRNGVVLEEEEGLGERVTEWEKGLPTEDDVTPLCQALIPPELASAFSISPEPSKTLLDVSRATQTTLSTLRGGATVQLDDSFNEDLIGEEEEEEAAEEQDEEDDRGNNKLRRMDSVESEAAAAAEGEKGEGAGGKRPRLVWTPQLHKRFVDVVAHLGIKNAVPKTIMQLMNVEGLTRENVASHLQKYRLYLKRQGGGGHSETHPSQSNNSASTSTSQVPPVNGDVGNGGVPYHHQPVSFHHHHHPGVGQGGMVMPMPMPMPAMPMPMPMYGHMGSHNGNSGNHHPHYHQQQQHQFNGYHSSSNQNGFDVSFGYNYSHHPPRVAPSGDT